MKTKHEILPELTYPSGCGGIFVCAVLRLANEKTHVYLSCMTLYEFSALSENDQAATTRNGEFLLTREDRDHTILLYKVHHFYVEEYYHNRSNKVVRYTPFVSKTRLSLYFGVQLN